MDEHIKLKKITTLVMTFHFETIEMNHKIAFFGQVSGTKVKTSYTNFASLVQSLLNVPLEKEAFFQVSLAAGTTACHLSKLPR